MISIYAYCTDRMLSDFENHKISFGLSEVRRSGKKISLQIEKNDVETLIAALDVLSKYGVAYQEDHDHDLSVEEKQVLEQY